MVDLLLAAEVFVAAYLLGSIPFGLVLTRIAGLEDIRKVGSGNIGATNVLRTGNKSLAALTLLLDLGKGTLAVLVAKHLVPDLVLVAAAGVILGHIFTVWLRFQGGKGVATAAGILFALGWPIGVGVVATWISAVAVTRISSAGALTACLLAPVYTWLATSDTKTTIFVAAMALLIILRHHANIRRLLSGEETRIKLGKS